MKKKIFTSFTSLIIILSILLPFMISVAISNNYLQYEKSKVKSIAFLLSDLINEKIQNDNDENLAFLIDYNEFLNKYDDSITIAILNDEEKTLPAKSASSDLSKQKNDYKTFIETGEEKFREQITSSNIFSNKTYYNVVRLSNGSILKVTKKINGILFVFLSFLPVTLVTGVVLLFCAKIKSKKLTENIVNSFSNIFIEVGIGNKNHQNLNAHNYINTYNSKNNKKAKIKYDDKLLYDELTPFVQKLKCQKNEMDEKVLALKNRSDTIEAITENMREGLILIDKSGLVLSANKVASKIFGIKAPIGKNILHICRETNFQSNIKKCLMGENSKLPFERNGKNYNIYINPVYCDKKITGVVILFFDISDKYMAEIQRREFSANVSHELKTPLTTISGLSEMIENGMAKSDDIKKFAAKITAQTKRLISIIEDIIKLSEFDEGSIEKDFATFDIYELTDAVINCLKEKAVEKNVNIKSSIGKLKINANPRMMDELLYNLIENAIKYNKENGKINIDISKKEHFCKIAISDTGIGISREHHSRVFERFYRVDKSRSKKTGGTGLGLSIVKHIAEYHGGRVELESKVNSGTKIICYIKL